jgi:anaerobic selenocysteine-containing dehydrogenase
MEGFHEGQKVWVEQPGGSQRPGVFVTDAEIPGCLGGPPAVYVVYPETAQVRRSRCCALRRARSRRAMHFAPAGRDRGRFILVER